MSEREQGCLNAHCHLRLGPPPRQHTNGPCNCLRDIPTPKRIEIEKKLAALRAQVERLEAVVRERKRAPTTPGCKCCTDTWNALAAVLRETDVDTETGRE